MTIAEFDHLDKDRKRKLLYECCGSVAWVEKMLTIPPAEDLIDLFEDAEEKWYECRETDWREAFSSVKSDRDPRGKESYSTLRDDEPLSSTARPDILHSLADLKNEYENKFGYVFVAADAGKSLEETLSMVRERLSHTPDEEIHIAMEEQNKITRARLEKLFES